MTTSREVYPFEQEARHFASGINHAGEVRGMFLSGRHVGITADDVNPDLLSELAVFAGAAAELFVDSGAFKEVEFGPTGPRVVKPIDAHAWHERFAVYRWAAALFRTRCRLVAPDRVGDQRVTLDRLRTYAAEIQAIARGSRCQIIVPVQKGATPVGVFFRQACAALALPELIAGVPMKKDATSLDDLGALVESMRGRSCRLHLLGIGPESPRWAAVLRTILTRRPDADITSDSVTIRRLVGRTNGRNGGPRALTAAQDHARAIGITGVAEVKAHALITQGFAELGAEKVRARQLGWRDEGDLDEG